MATADEREPNKNPWLSRLYWALGLMGAVFVFCAQTKVEDATSNISGWMQLIGADAVAERLADTAADSWVTAFGVILCAGVIGFNLWRARKIRAHERSHNLVNSTLESMKPLPQRQAVLYLLSGPERAPTRAVGDGVLVIFILDVWENGFGFTRKTRLYSEGLSSQIDWKGGVPLLQKCVITNYGPDTLTDIRLMVDGEIREVLTTGTSTQSGDVIMSGPLEMQLDKLDPGENRSFTFYIQNGSPFVAVLQLKDAEARSIRTGHLIRASVDTNAPARLIPLIQAS